MGANANKKLVTKFWRDLRSLDDLYLIDELYDAKALYHGAGGEEVLGSEDLKEYVSQYFRAFPDMVIEAKTVFGEDEWVASLWEGTGTHKGELQGMPATGKKMSISGATIQRFDKGKVVEEWEFPDMMAMMGQLGLTES